MRQGEKPHVISTAWWGYQQEMKEEEYFLSWFHSLNSILNAQVPPRIFSLLEPGSPHFHPWGRQWRDLLAWVRSAPTPTSKQIGLAFNLQTCLFSLEVSSFQVVFHCHCAVTCSLGVQPGLLVMRAMYSIKSNNTLDFYAFPPSYVPTSRLADPECVHGSGVRGMEGGQEESTAAAVCQRDHAQRRRQPQEQVSLQHFCSTFLQLFIGFCQM